MSSKEVKALLKQAREGIRKKEFKETLKHCKAVLKEESTNYTALVFVGVAAEGLEQPDQALAAYKRAIEADSSQPLAWQGLCGFYEKSGNPEYQDDLVNVYQNLIPLVEKDASKKDELSLKLAQLLGSLGRNEESLATYQSLIGGSEDVPTANTAVWQGLEALLSTHGKHTPEETKLLRHAYQHLVEQEGTSEAIWQKHIAAMLQSPPIDVQGLREACQRMKAKFPESPYPLGVLLHLCLDDVVVGAEPDSSVEDLVTSLTSLAPESPYLSLWRGSQCFHDNQNKQAVDLLKAGLSGQSLISGWVLLTRALMAMYDHRAALKTADKVLRLLKSGAGFWTGDTAALKNRVTVLRAEALTLSATADGLEMATQLCEQVLKEVADDAEAALQLVRIHLMMEDSKKARQSLERALAVGVDLSRSAHMEGQCLWLEERLEEARERLDAACEKHGTGSCWFWLGRVLWQMYEAGDQTVTTSCAEAFLKSAKLDPYYSDTFLYLGHYYGKLLGDSGKARRCYQKAYELRPGSDAAGCALVDALVAQDEHELAKTLLLNITAEASAGTAKWAWLRLGLQQVRDDEPSAAITSLQGALRADPADNHVWECLGEAYLKRGSYTAAMKAFTRATELDPESIYSYYQIASIKQAVGTFVEAVEAYEGLLEKQPQYVPALKGAGESWVELAKESLSKFFHGRAVDQCQAALPHLTRAATLRPDLSCVWKLLGDACTILYPLPEAKVKISVPAKLMDANADLTETKVLGHREVITLGGRCYGMALKQQPDCAALWHDLGVNYFYQSQLGGSTANQLAGSSIQALQKAVTLDAACHRHWTALGVVAASNEVDHPALAQHAFIQSTKVEQCNVSAWTNLGTLYLKHDQTKLAHEAFKVAQSLEPSFVASWVGQALIAESVGHDDAMDLFRHTTELAHQVEGSLGYAHWVCSTLREKGRLDAQLYQYCIERMAAVPAAADALARFTDRVHDNACAYNMQGLLLERLKLYQQSVAAFQKALLLIEDKPDLNALCRTNYARVLGRLGRYEESITEFEGLSATLTVEDLGWKGLAYYHVGKFTESVTAYSAALAACETVSDRSHLEAALGMVCYKAGDVEGAKSAFFRSFQCAEPSPMGLQALCALGLLQQDLQLAAAALAELDKQQDSQLISAHMAALRAHVADMQGDYSRARSVLVSAIHQHPDNYLLWRHLATFLLKHPRGKSSVAAHCAKLQALTQSDTGDAKSWTGVLSLAGLAGGLHSRRDNNNNGLRLAQKALHLYPDSLSNWCALMSAMYGDLVIGNEDNDQTANFHHTALSMSAHLMAKVESDLQHGSRERQPALQSFHRWCVQQYVLLLLHAGRTDQATQFLQQATWLYDSDPTLRGLQAFLQRDFKAMRAATQDATGVFPGQLLHVALAEEGLAKELRKAINLHIKYASSLSSKISCLVELALLAHQQLQLPDCDVSRWETVFEEASSDALDVQPDCPAIHLLLALQAAGKGEKRQVGHHARLVLEGERAGSSGALSSQARILLLQLAMKKGDEDAVKTLVADATEERDQAFLDFYKQSTEK